jgi:hypothetical protein
MGLIKVALGKYVSNFNNQGRMGCQLDKRRRLYKILMAPGYFVWLQLTRYSPGMRSAGSLKLSEAPGDRSAGPLSS